MAEVKWFKFSSNFFENRKVKLLQREKNGDRMIVVWLNILCLSSKVNDDGNIYITKNMPYTLDNLASEFGYKKSVVESILETLEKYEMITINNGFINVCNWNKYQNVDGLERIKTQTNDRVKRFRERQKCNVTETLQETQCNAIDKERRKKIEELDKKNKEKSVTSVTPLQTKSASVVPDKHKYGKYKHVLLTDDEHNKLIDDYPNHEELIKTLDEAKEMKGYKYKNDYLAIKKWVVDACKEKIKEERIF